MFRLMDMFLTGKYRFNKYEYPSHFYWNSPLRETR